MINNSTIIKTCAILNESMPLLDTGKSVLERQWIILLIIFFVVPSVTTLFITSLIEKRMSVANVKKKMWLCYFLTAILSFIAYIVLISLDFTFLMGII